MSGPTNPSGDVPRESHHLEYGGPSRRPSGAPLRQHVLAAGNVFVGVISLGFVPLALHIYSCTEDQKWCHFQAIVFGVPAVVVVLILSTLTAATRFRGGNPPGLRHWPMTVVAWLPLALAAGVLVALFAAVVHNS
jgi:hypothetical protein